MLLDLGFFTEIPIDSKYQKEVSKIMMKMKKDQFIVKRVEDSSMFNLKSHTGELFSQPLEEVDEDMIMSSSFDNVDDNFKKSDNVIDENGEGYLTSDTIVPIRGPNLPEIRGGSLCYYLQHWNSFKDLAILPEIASGPDIIILSDNVLIVVCIAFQGEIVGRKKLEKNSLRSNPLHFYRDQNGKVMKGHIYDHTLSLQFIHQRVSHQQLSAIVRIHIVVPYAPNCSKQLRFPQNVISCEDIKIKVEGGDTITIPTLVIDITGDNLETSGLFSSKVVEELDKKADTNKIQQTSSSSKEEATTKSRKRGIAIVDKSLPTQGSNNSTVRKKKK